MSTTKEAVRSLFSARADEWASNYAQEAPADLSMKNLRARQRFALELVEASLPPGAKILDAGCGPGEMSALLMERGYDVWGIDVAEPMVHHARRRCASTQFKVGDLERIDFPDHTFDGIVCLGVIEYLDTDGTALAELRRVLKPGGKLIISTPSAIAPPHLLDNLVARITPAIDAIVDLVRYRLRGRKPPARAAVPAIGHRTYHRSEWTEELNEHGFSMIDWRGYGWGWYRTRVGVAVDFLARQPFSRLVNPELSRNALVNWLGYEQLALVESGRPGRSDRASRAITTALPITYVAATLLTNATFMSDTADYVDSIVAFNNHINYNFWEFAHLLWRPLGWLISKAAVPDGNRLGITATLMAISWIAGLLSAFLVHAIVSRFASRSIANIVTVAFIFTQGFLNYAQAGTSYIPGLSLLLLGFYLLIKDDAKPILAGIALAGAVCFWVPYVLAIPGAVAAPLILRDRRWRAAIVAAISFAVCTALIYSAVIFIALPSHDTAAVRTWMSASSHGTDFRGATRMVFGFGRSFINMGNDGLLFKRFLLHDPFNHVSIADLLRLSLWKLGLFYLFIAAVAFSVSRRVLLQSIAMAGPVLLFAILFAGSDMERYLALYPVMFLALGVALQSRKPYAKAIIFTFLAVMIATNTIAMSTFVANRKQEAIANRVRDLLPRIDERSRVFVANWQDDLINFGRAYPFHPINRTGRLHLGALVTPGTSDNLHWREDFAQRSMTAWKQRGTVWVSTRALSPTPRAEWNWAEGDDRRVSWKDFPTLFAQLDLGARAGGDDGFVQLPPSAKNLRLMKAMHVQ